MNSKIEYYGELQRALAGAFCVRSIFIFVFHDVMLN